MQMIKRLKRITKNVDLFMQYVSDLVKLQQGAHECIHNTANEEQSQPATALYLLGSI